MMTPLFKILRHKTPLRATVCAMATLMPALAFAQAPPTPATPQAPNVAASTATPSAANCAPSQTSPKGSRDTSGAATTGQGAQPLGDQLAKSDGVLCPPPDVDPEIRAPTPEGGKMPVISPPGSPGGDPTVVPK